MSFGANETPVSVIREAASGGTYFRDIYTSVNEKWYRKSWQVIVVRIIMMSVSINMVFNV